MNKLCVLLTRDSEKCYISSELILRSQSNLRRQRKMKTIWLVVPCYNEEEVLPETSIQLKAVMNSMIERGKISPESKITFVNDGSKDGTWDIISSLCAEDSLFAGINLSRNRGHQNALLAGLMTAKKYADAAFDKATNSYIAAIKKGSSLNKDYSIRVKSEKNVSETKNDEILKEDSYSNAGNMSATTYDIPYTAKLGWEISASGLDEGALSLVKAAIAAQEGGSEGVYTVNKTFTAHVSGDYILYFSCKAKYVEKEYTFSIAGKKVTVKVKHYLGVEFVYTNQSSSMHGGGSIG